MSISPRIGRIGIIAQGGEGWAGGTEYVTNLLRAVQIADPQVDAALICSASTANSWRERVSPETEIVPVQAPRRRHGLISRFLPRNRHFSDALKKRSIDFLYPFTYDNHYNVGVTFPLGEAASASAWAGWAPDFQHRRLPHLFSDREIARREKGLAALAAEARCIVVSSAAAGADLQEWRPDQATKAKVFRFATFPEPGWYEPWQGEDLSWLPRSFFLISNQFWKHKNHLLVFEALALLRQRGITPVVVCTGHLTDYRDPLYASEVLQKIARLGLRQQVMLLGLVPRRLQIELMRRAVAVIQPSLFEGWSTVVEDARSLGVPCVLSRIAVHEEQNPPGARFFPPDSPEALAEELASAWDTLLPGPIPEREAAALAAAQTRIAEVGADFLRIAAGCIAEQKAR